MILHSMGRRDTGVLIMIKVEAKALESKPKDELSAGLSAYSRDPGINERLRDIC